MTDEKKKKSTRLVPPKKEPKFVKLREERISKQSSKQSYVEINRLKPDYNHWAKLSSWTCTEMIFLAYPLREPMPCDLITSLVTSNGKAAANC